MRSSPADVLQEAEKHLQDFLQDRSVRGEVKTWLLNTLAHLQHISPGARKACFKPYTAACAGSLSGGRSGSQRHHARRGEQEFRVQPERSSVDLQLLQLLSEAEPAAVSALLVQDADWLCDFFTASRDTIRAWFQHFGPTGIQHFKHGAKALANYALAERAGAWQHLVWSGKHSQSPVAVAAKPYYFGELDVVATIHKLARSCPGFWCSRELLRSCQAGDWLALDRPAVAKELLRLMHDERSSRCQPLCQLVSDFLANADWAVLCNRLLPLLPSSGVLQAVDILAADTQLLLQQGQLQGQNTWQLQHQQPSRLLLSRWCHRHTLFVQQHAVCQTGIPTGPVAPLLQAVPAAALDLPCLQDCHLLLLGCLKINHGNSTWTMDRLVLSHALTCSRSQLLTLLWQDQDETTHLQALAAAGQALFATHTRGADATSASCEGGDRQATVLPAVLTGSVAGGGGPELVAALLHLPQERQILLVLVAAWLLRFRVLLLLATAASHQQPDVHTPSQQQPSSASQILPALDTPAAVCAGSVFYVVGSNSIAAGVPDVSGPVQKQVQAQMQQQQPAAQQQQVQMQQQQQQVLPGPGDQQPAAAHDHQQQQQQQNIKQPLRRGQVPSSQQQKPLSSSSSDLCSTGVGHTSTHHTARRHKKHRRRSAKHRRKRQGNKHHRSRSAGTNTDATSSSSSGRHRRTSKHKRRRKSTAASTSSSSSQHGDGNSDADWAGMDLDAGGELLDPSVFNSGSSRRRSSSRRHKRCSSVGGHLHDQHTALEAKGTPVAASASGTPRQSEQHGQQQQPPAYRCDEQQLDVQAALSLLGVGGELWQWPRCLAVLPCSCITGSSSSRKRSKGGSCRSGPEAEAPREGLGSGEQQQQQQQQHSLLVDGTITQVADAAAQHWLWSVLCALGVSD